MTLGPALRHHDSAQLIAALDIGSSKVACLIAAVEPGRGSLRVLGFAQQRSRGVKSGVVIDLAAAQQVVRAVVAQAEQMAQARITAVHVAVDCGRPRSTTFSGHVMLGQGVVRSHDVAALASGAEAYAVRDGRVILALDRIGYRLDGVAVSSPPIGLAGRRLDADHHAVSVDEGPLSNLALLVETCHLEVAGLVPAAYASALGATTEEERRLGVLSLDIGAGVTSIAMFADGHLLLNDLVPVGGQHLTLDIARGLGIPLAEAERIKALYGTLVSSASDEHELVSYPIAGEDEHGRQQTTKAAIGRIVRQRMQGLLALVGERIAASQVGRLPVPRVVLSGGASCLLGVSDFVASGLATAGQPRPLVRVACPALVEGLVGDQSSPAFACLAGLLVAAQSQPRLHAPGTSADRRGYLGRMERWLQESF